VIPYNAKSKQFSRKLRRNMTDAENLLWKYIRRKQICDIQFYRQKPIKNYIVDFYAPSARLVIELDGGQHFFNEPMKRDNRRDMHLASLNLKVLRFDNWQVLKSLDDVLNEIYRVITLQLLEL
jgi:very-short-patch-repair endonuclease